jgi:hypothetical protein
MSDEPRDDALRPWPAATPVNAPAPQLVVDDNPEVGRLLGPDGQLARIVRAKPERQIGFRPR